jgi:CheY-like chemotaxis protein
MLNIINDIITISKVESGQMKIALSPTNINELIEYIYTFFKPEAEQKGIQLLFKKSLPAKEALLNTDKEKLYAILTNLVKNAIKYSDSGTIEIGYTYRTDKACLVSTPNELEFFVRDTGIGIPKDRQEAIFDRFVQADIADKRAFQGAGLGLSISKAYVEMLGGKIRVDSKEGKGSVFYFTLPCNFDQQGKSVPKNIGLDEAYQGDSKSSGLKILIAEDDEISGMLLAMGIKNFGKEVLKARTGVEAVETCLNHPDIDLVLMDIKMPEMDGYEATRQIRQFNNDVVIIAQTAYALSGDREKAIAVGCNDYIAKPFGSATLQAIMRKHF